MIRAGEMAMLPDRAPNLTWKVDLPGRQSRLREAILFVAIESKEAEYLGLIKLNKILWRADFEAFARRGLPVTGRQYQRLERGPAPVEMKPVIDEMLRDGLLRLEPHRIIDYDEKRPIAQAEPNLRFFSQDDLDFLRASVGHYWNKTGREASDESHGLAWKTRQNGDLMPYNSAYFSDAPINARALEQLKALAAKFGWHTH